MKNIEKLILKAKSELDCSATHDGLNNCDLVAKAESDLIRIVDVLRVISGLNRSITIDEARRIAWDTLCENK